MRKRLKFNSRKESFKHYQKLAKYLRENDIFSPSYARDLRKKFTPRQKGELTRIYNKFSRLHPKLSYIPPSKLGVTSKYLKTITNQQYVPYNGIVLDSNLVDDSIIQIVRGRLNINMAGNTTHIFEPITQKFLDHPYKFIKSMLNKYDYDDIQIIYESGFRGPSQGREHPKAFAMKLKKQTLDYNKIEGAMVIGMIITIWS